MGAFEFDSKADLSARSCNFCGNGSNESNGRNEETCIIVQKIFDQCRIQKCLGSSILGPARAARSETPSCNDMLCEGDIIIPPCNAADVTIRDLDLTRIEILRKRPNPLQKGCWDIELKYVFNYTLEFRRADGSRLMVLSPDPVHYRQGGRWQDIDNRLVEALDDDGAAVFTNRAGAMAVRLPRRFAPGAPITLTHRGYRLRYRMEGDFPARAARTSLRDRQLPHTAQVDSTLYFPDVFPQVDVSYTLHANELKEAIRLKARPDTAPVFTFQVEAPGLAPFLQPDGSLSSVPRARRRTSRFSSSPRPFLSTPGASAPTMCRSR